MAKNVLIVHAYAVHRGGSEAFLAEWLKNAPKGYYNFFWYCLGEVQDREFFSEIEPYIVSSIEGNRLKEQKIKRMIDYHRDLTELVSTNRFDVIHINGGSLPLLVLSVRVACKFSIPVRIVHSHSCLESENILKIGVCNFLKLYLRRKTTWCVACSTEAGITRFGKEILGSPKWKILQNTIDTKKFIYNENIRTEYREKLQMSSQFVMGCVGNPDENKNQILTLQLLKEMKNQEIDNVKLVLIGKGPQDQYLRDQAQKLGIAEDVCFLGNSNCVENWLQAMDIFLMPSKSEGLGIAALEAQAAGLPCVLSDRMPREVKISDNVEFVSIENIDEWMEAVKQLSKMDYDREEVSGQACKSGIDVSAIPQYMDDLYYSL